MKLRDASCQKTGSNIRKGEQCNRTMCQKLKSWSIYLPCSLEHEDVVFEGFARDLQTRKDSCNRHWRRS